MSRLDPEKHAERLKLYSYGMPDGQIARRLGLDPTAIWKWRVANHLPPHRAVGTSPAYLKKINRERMALYRQGLTDREMADRLRVEVTTIWYWRKAHGLPLIRSRRNCRACPDIDAQRVRLYQLGRTDRQIAAVMGVLPKAIAAWRYRRGLAVNDGKPNPHGPAQLVSMDADLGDQGFNLHGLIADDVAAQWLEDNGATVW